MAKACEEWNSAVNSVVVDNDDAVAVVGVGGDCIVVVRHESLEVWCRLEGRVRERMLAVLLLSLPLRRVVQGEKPKGALMRQPVFVEEYEENEEEGFVPRGSSLFGFYFNLLFPPPPSYDS